jgi:hypothetical protein
MSCRVERVGDVGTLMDHEVVRFLAFSEENGVELKYVPDYLRRVGHQRLSGNQSAEESKRNEKRCTR